MRDYYGDYMIIGDTGSLDWLICRISLRILSYTSWLLSSV